MKDLFESGEKQPAAQAAEDGIAQASDKAERTDSGWKDYAVEFIRNWLARHEFMHADDLWDHGLEAPEGADKRAIGQCYRDAQAAGWMEQIPVEGHADAFVCKPSVHSHNAPMRIWRSLIYSKA